MKNKFCLLAGILWACFAMAARAQASLERCYVSVRQESIAAKAIVDSELQEMILSHCLELYPERRPDYPKARAWDLLLEEGLQTQENFATQVYQVLRWAEPRESMPAPVHVWRTVETWKNQLSQRIEATLHEPMESTGIDWKQRLGRTLERQLPKFSWGRTRGFEPRHSEVFGTDELHLSFYPVPSLNEFKATLVHELSHLNPLAQRTRNNSRSGQVLSDDLFDLGVTEEVSAQVLEHMARTFMLTNTFLNREETEQQIISSFRRQLQILERRVLTKIDDTKNDAERVQWKERATWSDSEILDFVVPKLAER